ncbi:TenA family protein [Cellulosimicrobium arenosum]|uniref:TenA family protein n=1 Tax=Cellulosimicrobium arenosum TaxID=2708133 RepID=A0A927IZT8_9MICO|nr:TenA family protein [Cellulosimicrobium arenosum]MBD8078910.1 TenA family protein [Cellulosimicrobium arenosum]
MTTPAAITLTDPTTTAATSTSGPRVLVAADEVGFTADLGRRYAHLFAEFYDHPFLAGLRDGTVARDAVRHYVGQDHQYLTAYLRCYGLGMSLAPDRDWAGWFHDKAGFLLDDESHAHHAMCEFLGVPYAEAQTNRLAPSAQAYIDHMLACGHDSLGVLLASLLPCPWTYIWSARRFWLAERPVGADGASTVADDHPLAGWWEFYAAERTEETLADLRGRIDALAADAGEAERARMERAFELSCRHEIRFWQMAQTLETW